MYFSRYQSDAKSNLVIGTSSAQSDTRGNLSGRAIFGQTTINATPDLRFIASARTSRTSI